MASTSLAESRSANISRSKNLPWFQSKIGSSLTPAGRELLEKYSGVDPSDVENHIYNIRDRAWEIFPWPCVGEFWFITLGLSLHPSYASLLSRLRSPSSNTKFLDLGTCLGQDLRKLVFDGASPQTLYGLDAFPEYEDVGHELFHDADTLQNHFIAADIFDEAVGSKLAMTEGTWDVISIIMFLHIYDWDTQVRACKRILKLWNSVI